MKKSKKSGGIAIPFLLTFLISLIIIGGAALIIYDKINSEDSSLVEMKNEGNSLSDADSHSILFVLDLSDSVDSAPEDYSSDDEDYSDDDYYDDDDNDDDYWDDDDMDSDNDDDEKEIYSEPYTFLLMRSAPVHKQITFIGLPSDMSVGGKTMKETYTGSGASVLCKETGSALNVEIDRYMVLDTEAFQKLCNIFGGANFVVPGGVKGFPSSAGEQYLGPQQMEKLISYGGFSGETQRISTAASLITAMVNQANGERIADNLDNTFDTLVNMTETDISALDYQEMKYGIKFLLKFTKPADDDSVSSRAKFITPYGRQSGDSFTVDEAFISELAPYFKEDEQNSENDSSDLDLQTMIPETGAANE